MEALVACLEHLESGRLEVERIEKSCLEEIPNKTRQENIQYFQYLVYLLLQRDEIPDDNHRTIGLLVKLAALNIPAVYPGIVTWVVKRCSLANVQALQVWEAWLVNMSAQSDMEGTIKAYTLMRKSLVQLMEQENVLVGSFMKKLVKNVPVESQIFSDFVTHVSHWPIVLACLTVNAQCQVSGSMKQVLSDTIKIWFEKRCLSKINEESDETVCSYDRQEEVDAIEKIIPFLGPETCKYLQLLPFAINKGLPLPLSVINHESSDLLGYTLSMRLDSKNRRTELFIHKSILFALLMFSSSNTLSRKIGSKLLSKFSAFHNCSIETLILKKFDSIIDSLITYLKSGENLQTDAIISLLNTLVTGDHAISANVLIDLVRIILKTYKPRNFPLWALQALHTILKQSPPSGFEHNHETLFPSELMANEIVSRTKYCIDIEVDTESANDRNKIVEKSVMATIACMEAIRSLGRSHQVQIVRICEILVRFIPTLNRQFVECEELDIRLVTAAEVIAAIASLDSQVISFFRERLNSDIMPRLVERLEKSDSPEPQQPLANVVQRLLGLKCEILSPSIVAQLSRFFKQRPIEG